MLAVYRDITVDIVVDIVVHIKFISWLKSWLISWRGSEVICILRVCEFKSGTRIVDFQKGRFRVDSVHTWRKKGGEGEEMATALICTA